MCFFFLKISLSRIQIDASIGWCQIAPMMIVAWKVGLVMGTVMVQIKPGDAISLVMTMMEATAGGRHKNVLFFF